MSGWVEGQGRSLPGINKVVFHHLLFYGLVILSFFTKKVKWTIFGTFHKISQTPILPLYKPHSAPCQGGFFLLLLVKIFRKGES